MTLAARLDEMIVLYTLDGRTIRQIADRYGASPETVKLMLVGAGVDLHNRPLPKSEPAAPRLTKYMPPAERRPAPVRIIDEAEQMEDSHVAHVRAVRAALGGKGFPFYVFRGAAAA